VLEDRSTVNASSSALNDYLNYSSLLTSRDNSRQSIADILAFRLFLNAIIDGTGLMDLTKVHFISHSLGAITGIAALAIANKTLDEELSTFNNRYAFSTAAHKAPAVGVQTFILQSPDFGSLVKGSSLVASSEEFVAFLNAFIAANNVSFEEAIRPAFSAFEETLNTQQLAAINVLCSAFGFAGQTALNSADPINHAQSLGDTIGILLQLLVGGERNDDGSIGQSDQVNPV
jgi:hypothetical protein